MKLHQLFDLGGKVAIVTGGARGLGHHFTQALAEAGANVVICSRKIENCQQVAEEISGLGVRTLALGCDVSSRDDIKDMVSRVVEEFGRIDILVNNAGVAWGCPIEQLSQENWERVMRVNVDGVFYCTQMVGKQMIKQCSGKIINLASVVGLLGAPDEILDSLPYNTSKGAIVNFTRDLAVKWAKYGINVNAIAPGWFPTKMTKGLLDQKREKILQLIPLQRLGNEEDLKGTLVYLASAASNYVTGQVVVVDGGYTSW